MTTEAKFRVGDIVRLRKSLDALTFFPGRRWRCEIPSGVEGVVKVDYWCQIKLGNPKRGWLYRVVFPEAGCHGLATPEELEFIAHQPSPEEIAAMYAEAR